MTKDMTAELSPLIKRIYECTYRIRKAQGEIAKLEAYIDDDAETIEIQMEIILACLHREGIIGEELTGETS